MGSARLASMRSTLLTTLIAAAVAMEPSQLTGSRVSIRILKRSGPPWWQALAGGGQNSELKIGYPINGKRSNLHFGRFNRISKRNKVAVLRTIENGEGNLPRPKMKMKDYPGGVSPFGH